MQKQEQGITHKIKNIFYNDLIIEKALVLFLFLFLYSIYDLLSFIVLSIFLISLYITFSKEIKQFKHKGLIHYLPSTLQNLLTKSSFFDLFTLFWNPNFFMYLKIFYKPFFHNISPEEAVKTLDELPEQAKNVILTKGIIYSLPPIMKQILLPQQIYKEICQREEEEKNEQENQEKAFMIKNCDNSANCECENCQKEESKDQNNKWGVVNVNQKRNKANRYNENQNFYKNVIEEEDLLHLSEVRQDQFYKISQKSTLNFHKNFEDGTYENQNDNSIIQHLNNRNDKFKNEEKRIKDRVESIRKIMMEQPLGEIKTKLIASSQDQSLNKQQNNRENNSQNQINLEEGIQNMIEGFKKKFHGSSSDSAIGQIKSAVNLLLGVAEMKKKSNILQKIETTKMYKYFVLSAVFLLSQYFISKKTRRWLISSTMLVAYVVSFFLTFGSIGIYIYKNVNQAEESSKNNSDPLQSKRKLKKKLNKSTLEDSRYLMDDQEF